MISGPDAIGPIRPLPVLRAKKRLKDVEVGGMMRIRATDPDTVADFEAFCAETGHTFLDRSRDRDVLDPQVGLADARPLSHNRS